MPYKALRFLCASALATLLTTAQPSQVGAGTQVLSEQDLKHFQLSLKAGDRKKWRSALTHARRTEHPLPLKIATWRWLSAEDGIGQWEDLRDFRYENPNWPLPERILRIAESRMPSDLPSEEILAWFADNPPVSGIGRIRHAEVLPTTGPETQDTDPVRTAWIEGNFYTAEEVRILHKHKETFDPKAHALRLDRLIWDRKWGAARRQLRRVPPDLRLLGKARIMLAKRQGGVDLAVKNVPEHLLSDPGLIFERSRWRRFARLDTAVEFLDPLPLELGSRPEQWWREMNFHIRKMLSEKQFSDAYRLTINHGQPSDLRRTVAEAEWMAGWIALRFLDSPKSAYSHFRRMRDHVSQPISIARANYWTGLAARTEGMEEAESWFRLAAELPATFYGQLAAYHLGKEPDLPLPPPPSPAPRTIWKDKDTFEVARILAQARHQSLLRIFVRHLATEIENAEELVLLHDFCTDGDSPHLAIEATRITTRNGIYLPILTFPSDPQDPIFAEAATNVEPALLLAIIRQESAFNVSARSPAKALGLMQLIPSTARSVAREAGVWYRQGRLTTDPVYNVFLGSRYIASLLELFDNSYPLAIAAYNAGPGNVRKWIRNHGDPRTGEIEMMDWAELIPLYETRNYVQRVLEGLIVYRYKSASAGNTGRWAIKAADLSCSLGPPNSCPK